MDEKEESEDQPEQPDKGGYLGSFVYAHCPSVPYGLCVKRTVVHILFCFFLSPYLIFLSYLIQSYIGKSDPL